LTIGFESGIFGYMAKEQFFKSREEIVSMFIGLLIVIGVATLVVRLVTSKKGSIDLPGISDTTLTENKENSTNEKNENIVYVVKKGDYLSKIAKEKLGKAERYMEIAKLNNIKNPSVIEIGQELKMPTTESVEKITEHTVVKGDSLWNISVKVYGDGFQWTRIWNDNKAVIIDPGKLEIGMVLKLSQ
jgi:nucleoid-associated protein YgaU